MLAAEARHHGATGHANVVDGKATIAPTGRELAVGTPSLSLAVVVQAKRIVAKRTRSFVRVPLGIPAGRTAGGPVVVAAGGRTYRATLVNGMATLRLRAFKHRGRKKVRASYWDAARREVVAKTVTVRVRRAR